MPSRLCSWVLGAALVLTAASCVEVVDEADSPGGATESGDRPVTTIGAASPLDPDDACSPAAIGEDDGRILAIERVEGGERGARCFGVDVPAIDVAWELLATVTDPGTRAAIVRLVAFESDGETLAFAGPVDPNDNTAFYVAVDANADTGGDEFAVTVIHELAHVLTGGPADVDIDTSSFECETWHNGYGCAVGGGAIDEWVDTFWTDAALDALPVDGRPDLDAGDARCSLDRSFLGAYAASHPEEDLAETFAAYVLGAEVPPEADAKLDFFDARPRFAAVRDRAEAAGLVAQLSDECG